jgi:hypothetical protein
VLLHGWLLSYSDAAILNQMTYGVNAFQACRSLGLRSENMGSLTSNGAQGLRRSTNMALLDAFLIKVVASEDKVEARGAMHSYIATGRTWGYTFNKDVDSIPLLRTLQSSVYDHQAS